METEYILCDSHAHLTDESFKEDLETVITRARETGVGIILVPGTNVTTSNQAIRLAEKHEGIYAAAGLHPHDAKYLDSERDELERIVRRGVKGGKIIAIGETGLDYHYGYSTREDQLKAFRWHIGLAHEMDLPVIIHSREAEEDIKKTVKLVGIPAAGGVLHCFTGSKSFATWGIDRGLHISFSGTITFKERIESSSVTVTTPVNKTLVETDSPYLAPSPKRGRRNEPANLPYIADRLGGDRKLTKDDIYAETTLSTRKLFRIPVDFAGSIVYEIGRNLYINLTNRCTNRCAFCIRESANGVGGYDLRLRAEPTVREIAEAIGDPTRYKEVVFCGYGEPTIRWQSVKEVARLIKRAGGRVRLNTNGLGVLINEKDITQELPGLIDRVSVSLNAADPYTYTGICRSKYVKSAWPAVLDFIKKSRDVVKTRVSMVKYKGVNETDVRSLADALGVPLKVRR
jgi:TatD DNase family protein